jgi:hypothetical protein
LQQLISNFKNHFNQNPTTMKRYTFSSAFPARRNYRILRTNGCCRSYEDLHKVKGQYDGLVTKWKPYNDMAIQNADKLSPLKLKTDMQILMGKSTALGRSLMHPKSIRD